MTRAVRLRPWQKAALDRFSAHGGPDFLAVATPGAGKTTFALTAAVLHLADHRRARVVVVAPTQHLKGQWAAAAARFDLHLDPAWAAADGALPADMHGIVTTYQQVATSASVLRRLSADAFVVLDEVHHAGDDRAWGTALVEAFEPAGRRLSLSGTPFRSDTRAIPFVRYHLDEARPDFEYGYGDALAEGRVVRPVFFPRMNGTMEWIAPDGALYEKTFEDPLDRARANQRLRTALSLEGEWLPAVLRQADDRLVEIRRSHPEAGGLVIAVDQDHARGIADLLRVRFRTEAVVATSDDPTASARIARFAAGTTPWIVAVRMVSEGVDIPRLRVGVYATTTTTELFFRQAVGRLVRWTPGSRSQRSFLYIPDDVRLRTHAFQIADQRRHSLRRGDGDQPPDIEDPTELDAQVDDEQLSLFAALSAMPMGDPTHDDHLDDDGHGGLDADHDHDGADHDGADHDGADHDGAFTIALVPPPRLTAGDGAGSPGVGAGAGVTTLTRSQQKKQLREANATCVRELARYTGLEHSAVNAELNRLTGLRRVTEATVEQLERRLQHAQRWLAKL